jgi:hypothetical protein
MPRVAYFRLDGEPGTFDPDVPTTLRWEGPPEPVRLRSEKDLLESDPDSLEPISTRTSSLVLFRSAEGPAWILHERRKPIRPSFEPSDPRRGRKNAQVSLQEAARQLEIWKTPVPDVLATDIEATRSARHAPRAEQPPRHLGVQSEAGNTPNEPPASDRAKKPKRSTERGEGQKKLIGALTKHHKYADGGCLDLDPIGNNDLARAAGVWPSTASAFFKSKFGGHTKYRALCRDAGGLADALKVLNGEFSPHDLYGRRPAGEYDRDDD